MQTDEKLPAHLRADCSRCCALCCVVPPFDLVQGFGFDKPAHTPCFLLGDDFSCSIHPDLIACGFIGCALFDCHGAGQRTTQQMFGGSSWREFPDLAGRMFRVYSRLRVLHEVLSLLVVARERLCKAAIAVEDIDRRIARIDGMCNVDLSAFELIDVGIVHRDTMSFLRTLRPALRQPAVTGFLSS